MWGDIFEGLFSKGFTHEDTLRTYVSRTQEFGDFTSDNNVSIARSHHVKEMKLGMSERT